MTLKNSYSEYGSVAKFFHWVIFILILIMLVVGFLMGDIHDKAIRGQVYNIHKLVGLLILLLVILRLVWAIFNTKPVHPPGTPEWQRIIERVVHGLIYLSILAMPIAGWITSSAANKSPHLFSWQFALPIPYDKALSKTANLAHYWLAIVIIALVSLHILAALYHQFVKKDDVMRRMLP